MDEQDRKRRYAAPQRFLQEEVWPLIPDELHGKPISKEEVEEILGLGPDGV
ncbi:MAG TPA: hypothetical protein VHZ97_10390 [Pseudonocardiaceae bacterium]|nr:hypothetical protein [Pseudonocardiaceae bacterium]